MRKPLVLLVWSGGGLPFLTMPPFWARAGHWTPLPIITAAKKGLDMTESYVGLELVVGGAVDEGDVMLFFIG